jgi:hypothetical protein
MPLLPLWAREGFDSPEAYAESLATPAPAPAAPPAPVAAPVAAPRSVNKIDAQIARNYLRSMGFDPTGLNAQQLADKLHQITPSEYYEITGWTPDTPAAAPQITAAPPAATSAAQSATVAPVAEEEPAVIVDEFGNVDPESKIAKRRQGFEPVYNPMNYPYPGDKGGFGLGQFLGVVLAVASIAVPGIGTAIGAAILGESAAAVGAAVGLSAAQVSAAVGSAAISAATTAAQGGSAEDILRNAAGAGLSTGLNLGLGGGVGGAVVGSTAGTIVKGGDAEQILTNAVAAGAGAGVSGVYGPTAGTAVRTLITTGNVDQALLSAALTEIGAQTQGKTGIGGVTTQDVVQTVSGATPVSSPVSYGGYSYTEMSDGTVQRINEENGKTAVISSDAWSQIKEGMDPSVLATQATAGTLAPVTVVGSTQLQDTTYNLLSDGGAEYIDSRGTKRTLSPQEWAIEQNQLGGTAAPTLAPKTVVATTLPPSADTQILSLMNATSAPTLISDTIAPTLPLVTVSATTLPPSIDDQVLNLISPTAVPTLPVVAVTATTGLPTNPPWWDQMTVGPTLPVVTVGATTVPVTLAPTLPVVTVSATTELPTILPTLPVTLAPTLPPVTISATTEVPTFPPTLPPVTLAPVTISATTELPTFGPTLPPVTIEATTDIPTLPPETTPPVTTLPPVTTAPPTIKVTKEPTYPVVISVTPAPKPRAPSTITGASPARLLADALAAYRPSGAIEGEESGKERQNVWNEKSLRLKDALGL